MPSPLISVIVPVYNCNGTISACIQSKAISQWVSLQNNEFTNCYRGAIKGNRVSSNISGLNGFYK